MVKLCFFGFKLNKNRLLITKDEIIFFKIEGQKTALNKKKEKI